MLRSVHAAEMPVDEGLLEFLGSVDSDDKNWHDYLAGSGLDQVAPDPRAPQSGALQHVKGSERVGEGGQVGSGLGRRIGAGVRVRVQAAEIGREAGGEAARGEVDAKARPAGKGVQTRLDRAVEAMEAAQAGDVAGAAVDRLRQAKARLDGPMRRRRPDPEQPRKRVPRLADAGILIAGRVHGTRAG